MAENHEGLVAVAVAVRGLAEDDVAVVADKESQDADEREIFISSGAERKGHRHPRARPSGTRDQFRDRCPRRKLMRAPSLSRLSLKI